MTVFGIIFFILIGLGVFVITFKEMAFSGGFEEVFLTSIVSVLVSVLISSSMIIVIICILPVNPKYEKDKNFGITYISSLSINSSISGNFCLGSGTINAVEYYYFVSNSNFGYKISKIENDDNTYVKEDCHNNNKPFIEYTKYKAVKINWFLNLFLNKSFFDKDGEVIIHVPKNTVVKNYNVDVSKL